ncbi:MAG: hypothetical protein K9G67_12100 [Bacteroidales bacterium]|nr:hypothetical protein [Bacteroidales bacterium]MCF8351379.1 hypothetical protein [Bacteroidales bacterium]MCF8377090.1 hypothetical protein [Bacteroidales bacterium]MCF8402158.1 hypothetical protein [Bacteroidales bacterium]
MKKSTIPPNIKEEVLQRIDQFNNTHLAHLKDKVEYMAEFKGKFLYLNRKEFFDVSPVARLTYKGKMNNWDFAIFKWSIEQYDPEEDYFPGVEELNGAIEGAMKAGLKAYPVE